MSLMLVFSSFKKLKRLSTNTMQGGKTGRIQMKSTYNNLFKLNINIKFCIKLNPIFVILIAPPIPKEQP